MALLKCILSTGSHYGLAATFEGQRHLHIYQQSAGSSPSGIDDAGDYLTLSERLDKLQKPSSLKSWSALGAAAAASSVTACCVRFTTSIPGRLKDFRDMPRGEWETWKAGAWATSKQEAHHYWAGTQLLWCDIKTSQRLSIKAARGDELTRREWQQLTRTMADLVRLVPMVIILAVPFLELLLPVLLRVFPSLLPSTYEHKMKKEEDLKRRLSIRLELAGFLQDTVAEVAKDISRRKGSGSATDLFEFIKKVRSGERVENADIVRFAQLFNDELTLDHLERVQLVSICQFVGVAPFGTDSFLRSRLRAQLRQIKGDDFQIEKEGLENLTEEELRAACRARGMRGPYGEGSIAIMRHQLHDWLDLSLHRGLPSSLLLLSRAFTITANFREGAQKKALAYDKVGQEARGMKESSIEVLYKKLELLQREKALIKAELMRAAIAQAKKQHGRVNAAAALAAAGVDASIVLSPAMKIPVLQIGPTQTEEALRGQAGRKMLASVELGQAERSISGVRQKELETAVRLLSREQSSGVQHICGARPHRLGALLPLPTTMVQL